MIAVWWQNTSSPPLSWVMKPKPFESLNHFTVPVAILLFFFRCSSAFDVRSSSGPESAGRALVAKSRPGRNQTATDRRGGRGRPPSAEQLFEQMAAELLQPLSQEGAALLGVGRPGHHLRRDPGGEIDRNQNRGHGAGERGGADLGPPLLAAGGELVDGGILG